MTSTSGTLSLGLLMVLTAFGASTTGASQARVDRADCGASFVVPKGFEYIEVENPKLDDGVFCVVAFKRRGSRAATDSVGQPEGWREQADHVLEVKAAPLEASLADHSLGSDASGHYKLTTSSDSESTVRFKLSSATPFKVKNGSGLVADLKVTVRPASMIERGVNNQIVLIAGNQQRSVSYALWPSSEGKHSKSDLDAMTSLFESIEFLKP